MDNSSDGSSKPRLVFRKPAPAQDGPPRDAGAGKTLPTERLERRAFSKETPPPAPAPAKGDGAGRGSAPAPAPAPAAASQPVQTMGVSSDWQQATGSSSLDNRGDMTLEEVDNALRWMLLMPVPASPPPGYTLPTLVVRSPRGVLGFVNNHGHLWCHEAACHLDVAEAMQLVTGATTTARMNSIRNAELQPQAAPRPGSGTARPRPQQAGPRPAPRPAGRSMTGKVLGLLFGIPLTLFGALVVWAGFDDNNLIGGLVGGGLFLVPGLLLLFLLGFRSTRRLPHDPMHSHMYPYDNRHLGPDPLYSPPSDTVGSSGGAHHDAHDSGQDHSSHSGGYDSGSSGGFDSGDSGDSGGFD